MSDEANREVSMVSVLPTVTVLMPVFNPGRYLHESMRSVLGQTHGDFEFIVIDDGSTDGSGEVLEDYARGDERVKLVRQENVGLTVSLNRGLGMARGKYVARMDGDDICLPERFEKQVRYLDEHAEVAAVGSWIEMMDEDGLPIGVRQTPADHEEIEKVFMNGLCRSMCHPSVMFRREAVARLGGYREKFRASQDMDLWLRLGEVGRLANVQETLLRYRQHGETVGVRLTKVQTEWRRAALEDMAVRRGVTLADEIAGLREPKVEKLPYHLERMFFWIAWSQGHQKTARKFAWKAMRRKPLAKTSWRMVVYGMLSRDSKRRIDRWRGKSERVVEVEEA